jgi:hypothetical protein
MGGAERRAESIRKKPDKDLGPGHRKDLEARGQDLVKIKKNGQGNSDSLAAGL